MSLERNTLNRAFLLSHAGRRSTPDNGDLLEVSAICRMQGATTSSARFCVYLAKNEDIVRRHAEIGGFRTSLKSAR
jgi:hypothetical protein